MNIKNILINLTILSSGICLGMEKKTDEISKKQRPLGANPNLADINGMTPLMLSIQKQSLELIDIFLQSPIINLEAKNKAGETALDLAKKTGNPIIIDMLAPKPFDVDSTIDSKGVTPLMRAVQHLHKDNVELLLNGIYIRHINLQNNEGQTALMLAIMKDYLAIEIIKLLVVQPNIDLSIKDNKGRTALNYAQILKHDKAIALIKQKLQEKSE